MSVKNKVLDSLSLFLVSLTLVLWKTGSFLLTEDFAGRDLVGAYSLVKVFEFSWSTDWFVGVPMFTFYPPGFFGLTHYIGLLTGFDIAFKITVYSSLIVFPLSTYYCFNKLFGRKTGLIAGFAGIFLLFMREPFSLVYQTLQVGLVAQAAALPLLMVFIGLLWDNCRGSAYLSSFVLAGIILIHPYIGFVAVSYLLIYLSFSKNIFRTFIASLGLAMSGWWFLRALESSWYMQSFVGPSGQLVNWPWLFLPFLFFDRSKKALSLSFLGVFCLILGTVSIGPEIQHYRFFIYGQILVVLAAAPGIKKVLQKVEAQRNISSSLLLSIVCLSFVIPIIGLDVENHWSSETDLEEVVPDEGRIIVETSHDEMYESFVPIQTIPLESDASVVNGLYADGSISSPYLLGLEHAVAENPVPNPIAVQANLTESQIKERMNYFEIDYALVRTGYAREKLGFMEVKAENKDFTLLEHKSSYNRTTNAVKVTGPRKDWKNLQEHMFRNELRPDIIYSRDQGVDITGMSVDEIFEHIDGSDSKEKIGLENESIKPENNTQAVFGLDYTKK